MPPIPKPRPSAAPKARNPKAQVTEDFRRDELLRELGIDSPSGSGKVGSDSPPTEPLPKANIKITPTEKKLEEKIARSYKMLGAVIKPFRRWFPPAQTIGDGFKSFSDDAAEAWMEVARDDPKIKKKLEEWTSASAWGNLIGVHISIFEKALAKQVENMVATNPPDSSDIGDVLQFAKSMGLSDNEVDQALKIAGFNVNGPGDTVRVNEQPVPDLQTVKAQESKIQTPDQLGIVNDGQAQQATPLRTGGIQ